jgi:hypothetical protein
LLSCRTTSGLEFFGDCLGDLVLDGGDFPIVEVGKRVLHLVDGVMDNVHRLITSAAVATTILISTSVLVSTSVIGP